nr:hypothetical protein [Tanacetum cinerariifolium]
MECGFITVYEMRRKRWGSDKGLNAHDHSDGSHSSQPSSPTIDHYESDLGYSQGSNSSVKHVHVLNNQPLRRSERASVFPNKYNEYVVDSKKSKKQHTLAKSSAEAEYKVMTSGTSEVTWF